jgi:hypothetical protein
MWKNEKQMFKPVIEGRKNTLCYLQLEMRPFQINYNIFH